MPTDEWFKENPKVSAYITSELSKKLEEWMQARGIKKVSQALTRILEEYLGVVQTELIQPTLDDDRLGELETKLADLTKRFELVEGAIAALQTPIEDSLPVDQSSNSQLSILDEPQETEVEQSKPTNTEIWTTKEVERLGVPRKTLEGKRNRGELPYTTGKGYTIHRFVGKQEKHPLSNLWEVSRPLLAQRD